MSTLLEVRDLTVDLAMDDGPRQVISGTTLRDRRRRGDGAGR